MCTRWRRGWASRRWCAAAINTYALELTVQTLASSDEIKRGWQETGIGTHARMGAPWLPGVPGLLGVDFLNLLIPLVFAGDLPEYPYTAAHHEHHR